jgi:predicted anti-sigma-YlaC factor YlaD
MDCHEAKNYISLYIDEEISDNKAEELLQHTKECATCRQLLLDMEFISRLLGAAGQSIMAAPEGFKYSIMEELGHKKGSRLEPVMKLMKDSWKRLSSRINRHN